MRYFKEVIQSVFLENVYYESYAQFSMLPSKQLSYLLDYYFLFVLLKGRKTETE